METVFEHLKAAGVNAELVDEVAQDSWGAAIYEHAIRLKDQNINKIRLVWEDSPSCQSSGSIMRFQYEMLLGKEISADTALKIKSKAKIVKEGKTLGIFGGKITGVKWAGAELAETLNKDPEISKTLQKCSEVLGYMEFEVEAYPGKDIYIWGPRFIDPLWISQLYSSGHKEEGHECIFGYGIANRIAKHIKEIAG